ncbi:MAG: hypothetical protein QM760_19305 [Nibricoccus sp.]
MAYGRHFRDTDPMSGTLYSAATETLSVDVEVKELILVGGQPTVAPAVPVPVLSPSAVGGSMLPPIVPASPVAARGVSSALVGV